MEDKITKTDLIKIFFRSFLLPVGWNYERMQALGFLYTILPAIKKLYPEPEERKSVLLRNLDFFNTHPYSANIILGIVIGIKSMQVNTGKNNPELIASVKSQMAGPLAGVGDSMFWSTWRPLIAFITIIVSFFLVSNNQNDKFIGFIPIIVFIVVYNLMSLHVRYEGIFTGYRLKLEVIARLKQLNLQRWITSFRIAGSVLTVTWLVFMIYSFGWGLPQKVTLALLFLASLILTVNNVSSTKIFYLIIIFNLILSYFKFV